MFSERDLEDYLWKNPQVIHVDNWLARQFRVMSGIIDLIGTFKDEIMIIELKLGEINTRALAQAGRYAQDIKSASYLRTGKKLNIYPVVIGKRMRSQITIWESLMMNIHTLLYYFEDGNIKLREAYNKDEISVLAFLNTFFTAEDKLFDYFLDNPQFSQEPICPKDAQ